MFGDKFHVRIPHGTSRIRFLALVNCTMVAKRRLKQGNLHLSADKKIVISVNSLEGIICFKSLKSAKVVEHITLQLHFILLVDSGKE